MNITLVLFVVIFFEMWEDAYRHRKDDIFICEKCHRDLVDDELASKPAAIFNVEKPEKPDCDKCKHYWMYKGSGVNPDDICYGENDCRSCRVSEPYAWKFEAK